LELLQQTGVDREAAAACWWSGCYGADRRPDDQSQGCACVVDLPAPSIRKRRVSVNIKQREKSHRHAQLAAFVTDGHTYATGFKCSTTKKYFSLAQAGFGIFSAPVRRKASAHSL